MERIEIGELEKATRLTALRQAELPDTGAEECFDRLARLAARTTHAPIALITLVDQDRLWFKGCTGLSEPWATQRQAPLSHSFCQHVVGRNEPLAVSDARLEVPFSTLGAVEELGALAYLGAPLLSTDGHCLGTLAVMDRQPRSWTADQVELLLELSHLVTSQMELRSELHLRRELQQHLREAQDQLRALEAIIPICMYCRRVRDPQAPPSSLEAQAWDRLEELVSRRTGSLFSHGVCPDCYEVAKTQLLQELGKPLP